MLQSRVADRTAYLRDLRQALESSDTHFYLDTSFLISAATLHAAARSEVFSWLEGMPGRVHVPAWVAHELYGKINSDIKALTPLATAAGGVVDAVNQLSAEARRFVDDDRVATYRAEGDAAARDRVGFLSDLGDETRALLRRADALKARSSGELDSIADILVTFANGRVLNSDIHAQMDTLEARHGARLVGGQPPGGSDRKKDDNKYGDLIIWWEVVEHSSGEDVSSVVLLSNDNKPDWVYAPPVVTDAEGRPGTNIKDRSARIIYPKPLLTHELQQRNEGATLAIVNIALLASLIHVNVGDPFRAVYEAYQAEARGPAAAAEPPTARRPEAQPLPPVIPATPPPDLGSVVRDLAGSDIDAVSAAVGAARDLLGAELEDASREVLLRAVAEAADVVEPAALLLRDLTAGRVGGAELRRAHVSGLIRSAYFDPSGVPRQRALGEASEALFDIQTDPALRDVIVGLGQQLGDLSRSFLLIPDVAAPIIGLTVLTDDDEGGPVPGLTGLYHREHGLLEDAPAGSERTLVRLVGNTSGTVHELAGAVSRFFRVPRAQLRFNLSRSEVLRWDDLQAFVDLDAPGRRTLADRRVL